MISKEYSRIQEVIYQETLANGLTVTVIPKAGFHKAYAMFTTNYGSIDNEFIPLEANEFVKVPDGIAHFLEHKMFEKEDGDVFDLFSSNGASANAFTSFTRTSYLFSATEQIEANLTTLLDFVQEPYFTAATVEKEKGIIGQEIQMYLDEPDWRLFFALLNNLYPKHPLHIDIAGTVESIAEITAEDLYLCYETFYHPSNMNLLVVGNVDPEKIIKLVIANQNSKKFIEPKAIERKYPEETSLDIVKYSELRLAVTRPKVLLGIRTFDKLPYEGFQLLKFRTAVTLFLQMLFGLTSKNYLNLYNQGIADETFGYAINLDRGFCFIEVGGDTQEPEKLLTAIQEILLAYKTSSELNTDSLELLKRKMLGKHFQALNSPEYIANQFSSNNYGEVTLFDLSDVIADITLADVLNYAEYLINEQGLSSVVVLPDSE